MSFRNVLGCRNQSCERSIMIPYKLIIKGSQVVDVARCPRCKMSRKVLLPLSAKDRWIRPVAEAFLLCDSCGDLTYIFDTQIGVYKIKVITKCMGCAKKRSKFVSRELWDEIWELRSNRRLIEESNIEQGLPVEDEKLTPVHLKEKLNDFEQERYDKLFICKKCQASQVIVKKVKATHFPRLNVQAKCPKCSNSTNIMLRLSHIQFWLRQLAQNFFRCNGCGSSCNILRILKKNDHLRVIFYCEKEWMEFQKEIHTPLFQTIMTQSQKETDK